MAVSTLNDLPLLRASIHEPRVGAWHADLEIDSPTEVAAVGEAATLSVDDGAVEYLGTVYRAGVEQGRWIARIVGGAGGLRNLVAPRFYRGATFGTILQDALTEGGELLDGGSDEEVIIAVRQQWQRTYGNVAGSVWEVIHALNLSLAQPDYRWRVTRSGLVLVGRETWPELEVAGEIVNERPQEGKRTLAPFASPLLAPGTTFRAVRVDRVLTEITGGSVRQHYWSDE